jgi:hypothetical protein
LIVLMLACHPADPELATRRAALDAWEEGKNRLDAKDPAGAIASFDQALVARPDDPVLLAWKAKAYADQGDLDRAINQAHAALEARPEFPEMHYDLGAWLARSGRPEAAAREVRAALRGGFKLGDGGLFADADFAPYRDNPLFEGVVPEDPLTVSLEAPAGSVFWGSTFSLKLRVSGAFEPISVTPESEVGPFFLVDVVEDASKGSSDVVWTFEANGAGTIAIGPLLVTSGKKSASAPAITVEAKAPPGKVPPPGQIAPALRTPREIGQRLAPPAILRRDDGVVIAVGTPEERAEVSASAADPVRYSYREAGTPRWVVWEWSALPAQTTVRLKRGAEVRLEKTL